MTSVQRSVCICLPVTLAASDVTGWCPAVVPCHSTFHDCLCLLSDVLFWRIFQICSSIFVSHPTTKTIVFCSSCLSIPKSKQIQLVVPGRQLAVLLLLHWNELLLADIKFVCFPLLSFHECLTTNLIQPKTYSSWPCILHFLSCGFLLPKLVCLFKFCQSAFHNVSMIYPYNLQSFASVLYSVIFSGLYKALFLHLVLLKMLLGKKKKKELSWVSRPFIVDSDSPCSFLISDLEIIRVSFQCNSFFKQVSLCFL